RAAGQGAGRPGALADAGRQGQARRRHPAGRRRLIRPHPPLSEGKTMAETQTQADLQGVTLEGSDFSSLLQKEFKPKTDEARSAVAAAVQTLAAQALSQTTLISADVVKTIQAMIA